MLPVTVTQDALVIQDVVAIVMHAVAVIGDAVVNVIHDVLVIFDVDVIVMQGVTAIGDAVATVIHDVLVIGDVVATVLEGASVLADLLYVDVRHKSVLVIAGRVGFLVVLVIVDLDVIVIMI